MIRQLIKKIIRPFKKIFAYQRFRKKTPAVFQMETTECGAACLNIIMAYYKKYVPLSEVRTACDVTRDGSKAINIIKAAREYGLEAEGYSCDIEDLKLEEIILPCIVYWEFNHFVVLEGLKGKKVYINDPATGPRTITLDEFGKAFTGVVLQFKPADHFESGGKRPPKASSLIWQWLSREKTVMLYLFIVSVFVGLTGIFPALIMKIFVDNVLIKEQWQWSFYLVGILFLLGAATFIMMWMQQTYLNRFVLKFKSGALAHFIEKLLQLPFSFFQQRMAGDLAERTDSYDHIQRFISDDLINSAMTLVVMLFYLIIMFFISTKMACWVVLLGLANLSFVWILKNRMSDYSVRLAQKQGRLAATEALSVESMEVLKANALDDYYFNRWASNQAEEIQASQGFMVYASLLESSPTFFLQLNSLFVAGFGGYLVLTGNLTIGGIIAFQILSYGFYQPAARLFEAISSFSRLKGIFYRILDILTYEEEKKPCEKMESEDKTAVLSIENLCFGYSRLEPPLSMLEDFSLKIYPGQKAGIIGSSGSGKSTLLKLICGFYQPWKGGIYLGGKSIDQLDAHERAGRLGYVSQDIYLFDGSVRDNLTLWSSGFKDNELYEVLNELGLSDVIHGRGGLDSWVAAGGENFSGGQRQRLEVARALLSRPDLLILDEATSALDNISERKVYEAAIKYAKSLLIVAHRLSAIRDCDIIVVLQNGAVAEIGNHETLIKNNGFYANQLVEREK